MSNNGDLTKPQKKPLRQRVKEVFVAPEPTDRVEDAYGILKRVGGFQPIFNIRDLEQRRKEIKEILGEIEEKTWTYSVKKSVVEKTFKLFFMVGSPWYRGLDNRELAGKVTDFIEMYHDLGGLPAFMGDLFACSMQLLNLSWQALDVTNTPAYVAQQTPIVSAHGARIGMSEFTGGSGGSSVKTKHQEA